MRRDQNALLQSLACATSAISFPLDVVLPVCSPLTSFSLEMVSMFNGSPYSATSTNPSAGLRFTFGSPSIRCEGRLYPCIHAEGRLLWLPAVPGWRMFLLLRGNGVA